MRPASLHHRLPRLLVAGACVAAGLGLYTWELGGDASGGANWDSALVVYAVGTLLLAVAGLLASVGLALRVGSRPVLVRRTVARLVDIGLAAAASMFIGLGVAPLLTADPADASELRLIVVVFGVPLLAGLHEAVLVALRGQTVGKMLAGVRIQRLDGTPPGREASMLRAVPWLLLMAPTAVLGPALFLLMYLWTVATRDQRGLHDRLAGTRVIPA
jgi:uncharacterized RDD family membrane protein YckC